jgi:hypothetical protein
MPKVLHHQQRRSAKSASRRYAMALSMGQRASCGRELVVPYGTQQILQSIYADTQRDRVAVAMQNRFIPEDCHCGEGFGEPGDSGYDYYEASFLDSEGAALDKIRNEWLTCRSQGGGSLSEPVADTIQFNGAATAQGLNVWVPRLISGVNNLPQFAEIKFEDDNGGSQRAGLAVLFSGDPVTVAVVYQAYIWECATETPAMRIMKMTSATANSTLDTIAQAPVNGSVYRLEADFDGADVNLRVLEDGVEILAATDAGGYQKGMPGIQWRVMDAARLYRLSNFRCGILELA